MYVFFIFSVLIHDYFVAGKKKTKKNCMKEIFSRAAMDVVSFYWHEWFGATEIMLSVCIEHWNYVKF